MRTSRKKRKRLERRERQTKAKSLLKIQEALVRVKEEASRHIMNLPANIIRCRESAQIEKTSHISCGIKSVMRYVHTV